MAGVDAAANRLGVLAFEREFPAWPPATGPTPVRVAQGVGDASALDGFWLVHLPSGLSRERAIAEFEAASEVASAWPIAIVVAAAVPDDSLWIDSYYFDQPSGRDIHAVPAWDITTGDSSVIVAIVDTGVIPYHPDLIGQIWSNVPERQGLPGVDDDGNGFVDDTWGWDFVDVDPYSELRKGEDGHDTDNDPNDFAGHGTAVAGVVGASTNNRIGIAGTAWHARLMPLRMGWSSPLHALGEGDVSAMARCIDYATRMGASVINCSFTSAHQPDLEAAVDAAIRAGVTVVTAAGNFGVIHYLAEREDVISVAATDADDRITSWSTTRPYVDLAAPGNRLAVTTVDRPGLDSLGLRQGTYALASGTSFSAPLVAGAAALIQSARLEHGLPPLAPIDVLLRITDTAEDIAPLNPEVTGFGSGRLDLWRALTDPPTSRLAAARARLAGPGVVLPTETPPAWIAVPTLDRRVMVLDGALGAVRLEVGLPGVPLGGIAAADLGNGPGLFVATSNNEIQGLGPDLAALPGWPVPAPTWARAAQREPVLGDLDGDGSLEVLWAGGGDGWIRAWSRSGTIVPGFPRFVQSGDLAIAVADLDGRPGVEIVATSPSGQVFAIRGDGEMLPGWPKSLQPDLRAPVIARLGRRGAIAVICAGGVGVTALAPDGRVIWGCTRPGLQAGAPALADLDGDGGDEIVLLRAYTEPIAVLDSAGVPLPGWDTRPVSGAIVDPLLVVPLGPAGAASVLASVSGSGMIALDRSAGRLSGYPKPGGALEWPVCGDFDGDGRTEILAGTRDESGLFLYDAGPGSWREPAQVWATSRGNFARTGSRVGVPGMAPLDNRAPAAVTDLEAAPSGSATRLSWTAPADDRGRVTLYELSRTRESLNDPAGLESSLETFAPGTDTGVRDQRDLGELDENSVYTFTLRSRDRTGNWSAPSNRVTTETAGRRPATISDLRAIASLDSTVTFAWTATGDDGRAGRPRAYHLRAAEITAPGDWFAGAILRLDLPASRAPGETESATLIGFHPERRYRVGVDAEDDAGNLSTLSNEVLTWLGPLARRTGVALAPERTPSRSPVRFFWQAAEPLDSEPASIQVLDLQGRRVAVLALEPGREGIATWDGRDARGHRASAGVYFARLETRHGRATTRLVMLD